MHDRDEEQMTRQDYLDRAAGKDHPECRECGGQCEPVGSNWYCPFPDCERHATPCPHVVHGTAATEEEYEAACEKQADGDQGHSYYSSEAMDAARRIGH